jgi:hypothetical protein
VYLISKFPGMGVCCALALEARKMRRKSAASGSKIFVLKTDFRSFLPPPYHKNS